MKTIITLLNDETGKIEEKAIYTIEAKKALIAYIMQYVKNNWNTWTYPENIKGIFGSTKRENTFYYETDKGILQAYQY